MGGAGPGFPAAYTGRDGEDVRADCGGWHAVRMSLERIGLDERVLKTALAAALGWWLARVVVGAPQPYFAPLAAILIVQVTVAQTVSRGVQRVAGVVLGVAVAMVVTRFWGLTAWSIGGLVLAALCLGALAHLGSEGTPQVAVSALLVMIVGAQTRMEYAWLRAVETLVGAAVGVCVNALLVPPNYLPQAEAALTDLLREQAGVLRGVAAALGGQSVAGGAGRAALARARSVGRRLVEVRKAVRQAEESLTFNLLAVSQRRRLNRLRGLLRATTRVALPAADLARICRDALDGVDRSGDPCAADLAAAAGLLAAAVEDVGRARAPDGAAVRPRQAVAASRRRLAGVRRFLTSGLTTVRTLGYAAAVLDLERMADGLEALAARSERTPQAGRRIRRMDRGA